VLSDFDVKLLVHNGDSAALPSPLGKQTRYHALIQLARTLEERHRYAGDAEDLKSAARYGKEALALCQTDNLICPTVWVICADILTASFEATTNSLELLMAELLCREAVPLCMASHPLYSVINHTLSWIVMRRFEQSNDEALINEAVDLQRIGLEQSPGTNTLLQNRHRHLCRLSQLLTTKWYNVGHENQDDVISILEEALRSCPPMHVDKWTLYPQIMRRLILEHHHSGELELMNRAIELGRQAFSMGNYPNAARRASVLSL
jgi:hypothetical protein